MNDKQSRYSKLAPLDFQERLRLSKLAVHFFSPMNYHKMCEVIEKDQEANRIVPFNARNFLTFLEKSKELADPDPFMFRIRELLLKLADAHILTILGHGNDPIMGTNYYFIRECTEQEKESWLWLAPALGAEFILDEYSKITIQLTGVKKSGDIHAGTGIAIAPNWILTCAHVINDMVIDENQNHKGKEFKVIQALPHDKVDVAIIEVEGELPGLPGLAFRDPVLSEEVYTLGYPRVPLSKEAVLVMQRGEITNPQIMTLYDDEVFLYSAIARPGNSGGPIIASNGHVVGIVMEELSEEAPKSGMPFYAGVRTSELQRAISELEPSVQLPIEDYE